MTIRIANCSTSLENYYLCLEEKTAGFTKRAAKSGDTIYFAVKIHNKSYCGARGILAHETDEKPWEDAERYPQCFTVTEMEFCVPFELNMLKSIDTHWGVKYMMGSKEIKNQEVVLFLEKQFNRAKTNDIHYFNGPTITEPLIASLSPVTETEEEVIEEEENDYIDIMGTFQTVKFKNESDKTRGLEALVTRNFHQLFPQFPDERTILISDNRKFKTTGLRNEKGIRITGIDGIPDALLLVFKPDAKTSPFQVNLIEYECYGEGKTRNLDKFNYLNGHIIPQLMRFASTFSIVTDPSLRNETIETWTDKIMDYIDEDDKTYEKIATWVTTIHPHVKERQMALFIRNAIIESFKSNIRIMLIIDELTDEQKETIKSIISSFKLESEKTIDFKGYVVRLEQKVNIFDTKAEYALSFQ